MFTFILFGLLTLGMFLNKSFQVEVVNHMMYPHMSMSTMDWSSINYLSSAVSVLIMLIIYFFLPKQSYFFSRWQMFLLKFNGKSLFKMSKSYFVVMVMTVMVLINNMYAVFSYNWAPNTQYWFLTILTSMFLLSIWTYMIMMGGVKLFGSMVPMSWYIINFTIWMFHNLSFFIRFISLPFRMMMNLIVGCFLVEFAKSLISITSLVSIYELFVITVQSLVFIILCNMYYVEMMILPEWKHNTSDFKIPKISINPLLTCMKVYTMKSFNLLSL
uniref:ATP synthase membrane subunit 6 n=1 Tax=Trichuris sp. LO613 TaxID=2856030 RepID=A0A8F5HWW7_9BILA|nr:ATP synthase membrane subunit 6 [Trichuris sp. LO613]